MGKAARTKRTLKRAQEKRARKAANQAQYQRWAETGQNEKSRRAQARNRLAAKVKHRNPDARNIGDLDAFPELNTWPLVRLYLCGQYTGRYKARIREIALGLGYVKIKVKGEKVFRYGKIKPGVDRSSRSLGLEHLSEVGLSANLPL